MEETGEIESTPVRRRWGGGDVAIGLGASMCIVLALQVSYAAAFPTTPDEQPGLGYALVGFLGLWTGWLGAVFYASMEKGSKNLRRDFGVAIVWRKDVPLGAALAVAGEVAAYVMYLPLTIWAPKLAERVSDPAEAISDLATGWGLIPLGLAVCIGAPVVEEIFYRGLALRSFVNRWGTTVGIVTSSLLFGAIHYNPSQLPLQIPALVAFAAILAWAALRTGRLGPSIIGHCIFNTIGLITLTLG